MGLREGNSPPVSREGRMATHELKHLPGTVAEQQPMYCVHGID